MVLRLIEASQEMEQAYIDYISEWENSGEEIVPYASKRDGFGYNDLLYKWKTDATDRAYEKGLVPATLYSVFFS